MNRYSTAIIESVVAAFLWGFGFVAAVWAMHVLSPFALCFARFALASALLLPLTFFARHRREIAAHARMAFWPGVLFAVTLVAQTWGLESTTATKSGFITTLYVVFVPLLEAFVARRALPKKLCLSVGLAFLGTLLIVNVGLARFNRGDLLTLVCALSATAQIYLVGKISGRVRAPFTFNLVQAGWAALVCAPFATDLSAWEAVGRFWQWGPHERIGLVTLAFGSTVVAFGLQVRAQKRLSPSLSSLLFLLESPFAMGLAALFLGERPNAPEIGGALLITGAAVLACFPSRKESALPSAPRSASVAP